MIIDKNDELYSNPVYIQRIKEIRDYFSGMFKDEQLNNNLNIEINISLWKSEPRKGREIAASRAIKYLVEIIGSVEHPNFVHVFSYSDAKKFKFSLNDIGYIGENMIIYALLASGIDSKDIYTQYIFYDDPEFVKSGCKYDVYVKSLNTVFEHHGTQHIEETDYFVHDNTTARKSFEDRQSHDSWKKEYAVKRNVSYVQFSIYDFPDTYMELPVYKNINDMLSAVNLRTLSVDELNKVIVDSKTKTPSGTNNDRIILVWNSMRFVFHTQNEASEILGISKQTIKRWKESADSEFCFYNEYTTEDVNIPSEDVLELIKSQLNLRKRHIVNRLRKGCEFVAIYKDVNGFIQTEFLSGYESCAESNILPTEFRATKNYLKRTISRNSSEIAIKYGLITKYKTDCLFIKADVFRKLTEDMTVEDLFNSSGKNITKGKMPQIVCYKKENPQKHIIKDGATEMSRYLSSIGIKISSTSIENACFYYNHRITDIEPWRFCFLCEYRDRGNSLMFIEDKNKANSIKDIVLIWKGTPVAHGAIRTAEKILDIYREVINKQLKLSKNPVKGICDFKIYTLEKYGILPEFSQWNELDKFKQEYQSKKET